MRHWPVWPCHHASPPPAFCGSGGLSGKDKGKVGGPEHAVPAALALNASSVHCHALHRCLAWPIRWLPGLAHDQWLAAA